MSAWLSWLAVQGFLPHGYCLQWQDGLVGLMVVSDLAIALAYYSISAALLVLYRRRPDLRFRWVFILFSLFIFTCGTTHIVSLLNIWFPLYWVEGYTKAVTAAFSLATAAMLWPLLPRLMRMPTTKQLEDLVQRLETEVSERRRAEEELQALTRNLETRVQERTNALEAEMAERLRLQDADRAREAAEAANRAKSDFLSRMSHELRTPLNAVLGFSRLMQQPASGSDVTKIAEWSNHIERAGEHLLQLVNDILDVGRIEAGLATIQVESVYLPELVAECHSMLFPTAEAAGVALTYNVPSTLKVRTDGRRLRQTILNLVNNGIKYNRRGGSVEVAICVAEMHALQITITDTGIGMNAEQKARLFQPFNRLGRERGAVDGVGLGLVVVKNVVEMLKGTLHVESQEGVGTVFSLTWPVFSDDHPPVADAPAYPPLAIARAI